MTLYEIGSELEAIEEAMIEAGGEIPAGEAGAAFEAWMDDMAGQRDDKIRKICGLIANSETYGDSVELEIARLRRQLEVSRNIGARLKSRLKSFFEQHGIDKLSLGVFKPHIRANGGAQPLEFPAAWEEDPARAPAEFQKIILVLNKEALRNTAGENQTRLDMLKEKYLEDCRDLDGDDEAVAAALDALAEKYNADLKEIAKDCPVRFAPRGTHFRLR